MPRLAANISTMFQERPFLDRIAAAHRAGFDAIECQFPYEAKPEEIRDRVAAAGVELVLFNTPPGDFAAGERGLACLPGREADFEAALGECVRYVQVLGCRKVHVMAGIVPEGASTGDCWSLFKSHLATAADRLGALGCTALIEPINTRDIPGYLLNNLDDAVSLLDELGHDNIGLQYDFYHMQIMGGDLVVRFERHRERIPHVQIADVPGRHEPDTGEIDYPFVLERLDVLGYDGWVGCEYVPKGKTEDGLGWARGYGIIPRGVA